MRLKTKFQLIIALAAAGLLVLTGSWLTIEHSRILAEKKEKTRNLVETAHSVLAQYYQLETAGKLTREQAQHQALSVLGSLRYEGENYFWVNDLRPVMVMHPMKPQLNGKDLRDFKDPDGKALFVEMTEVVQKD